MNESALLPIMVAFLLCIGICGGIFTERSTYKQDTYDCTVKCPNMAHSIKVGEVCYCEVK